jgi:hypothetical protein
MGEDWIFLALLGKFLFLGVVLQIIEFLYFFESNFQELIFLFNDVICKLPLLIILKKN